MVGEPAPDRAGDDTRQLVDRQRAAGRHEVEADDRRQVRGHEDDEAQLQPRIDERGEAEPLQRTVATQQP